MLMAVISKITETRNALFLLCKRRSYYCYIFFFVYCTSASTSYFFYFLLPSLISLLFLTSFLAFSKTDLHRLLLQVMITALQDTGKSDTIADFALNEEPHTDGVQMCFRELGNRAEMAS